MKTCPHCKGQIVRRHGESDFHFNKRITCGTKSCAYAERSRALRKRVRTYTYPTVHPALANLAGFLIRAAK